MADTQLILHVKGTEQTTTLPRPAVRAGIAQGQISYSQLIWVPADHAWKQVREMPDLWPSQKLAPAPPRRALSKPLPPVSAVISEPAPTPKVSVAKQPAVAQPKVAVAAGQPAIAQPKVAATPKVAVAAGQPSIAQPRVAATPKVAVAAQPKAAPKVAVAQARPAAVPSAVNFHEGEDLTADDSHVKIAKWLCLGVGGLIALAVGLNYFMVDKPLTSNLASTSFAKAPVYAHLGAFVQPGALLIHVPVSAAVTPDNFPAFLVALAGSTPTKPGSDDVFDRVSLTPGWTGRYSFSGIAWDELGKMTSSSAQEQQNFILDQIDSASGQLLAGPDAPAPTRQQVWDAFVAAFTQH